KYGVKGSAFNWRHDTMDARTACDLVDKLFFSVRNSIWLPQNGFELWSVYYLLRKGMSLDRIKKFLVSFNAGVKERMIHGGRRPVSRELIESIATCSRFEDGIEPDLSPAEIYSGSRFVEAEQFWAGQFASSLQVSNVEELREGERADDSQWVSVPLLLSAGSIERLESQHEADLSRVLLAAYAVLLSRVAGREDAVIVARVPATDRPVTCPVRLSPSWEVSFRQFVEDAEKRVADSLAHSLYAFYILGNSGRLAEYDVTPPALGVGYVFAPDCGDATPAGLREELKYYPEVAGAMNLVLSASRSAEGVRLQLEYASGQFRREVVEKLASCFESIIAQVSDRPDSPLEEVTLGEDVPARAVAAKADESEVFNF
ncbi:MAG TPA: condensation domain-containing protein, partial [Blastocatellia bacterium]|nr:condensation domain-containing protein [Blastocatellia bacterium]